LLSSQITLLLGFGARLKIYVQNIAINFVIHKHH
jgi:hypothetical protein